MRTRGHSNDCCCCLIQTTVRCTSDSSHASSSISLFISEANLPVDSILQDHSLGLHVVLAYSVPLQVVWAVCKVAATSRHLIKEACRQQQTPHMSMATLQHAHHNQSALLRSLATKGVPSSEFRQAGARQAVNSLVRSPGDRLTYVYAAILGFGALPRYRDL